MDEVFAVVSEQAYFPLCSVEMRRGQTRFALCRAGDRECVDRIGLSIAAGSIPCVGH